MKRKSVKKHSKEEQSIVRAVKQGDTERFHEIEGKYHDKLLFYLWHLLGSKDEAEDILQDVFIKAFNNLERFDNRRSFSSWVYRIAHNEAINYLKRRNKQRSISWEDIVTIKDRLESADRGDSPQEAWIRRERRDEVRSALKKLSTKYREAILLRYYFDHSYEEMGDILEKPVNTVGTLLSRAKKRLLEILSEV